jgi:hypothetical protein
MRIDNLTEKTILVSRKPIHGIVSIIIGTLGLLIMILVITDSSFFSTTDKAPFLWTIATIALVGIIAAILSVIEYFNPKTIIMDDHGVEYREGKRKEFKVSWDEILKIEIYAPKKPYWFQSAIPWESGPSLWDERISFKTENRRYDLRSTKFQKNDRKIIKQSITENVRRSKTYIKVDLRRPTYYGFSDKRF